MPSKSRRATHGHATYRRRKMTRRELSASTETSQSAQSAAPAQVVKATAPGVQLADKRRHIMVADMRRTFILGGILMLALIAVSLILRYVITV